MSENSSQKVQASEQSYNYDVFISYSSQDKDWVRGELLTRIERAGLRAFIDFRDFERGAPSLQECARGVDICRKTILVLTPNYMASEWTQLEHLMLQTDDPANARRRLLPLLKTACDKPRTLRPFIHIDFSAGADIALAWRQLFTAFDASSTTPDGEVGDESEVRPSPNPSLSNSRGNPTFFGVPAPPRSFTGRDQERQALSEWLCEEGRPFHVLHAMGGMGKTSLASAWLHKDVLHQSACQDSSISTVFWHTFDAYNASQFETFVLDCWDWLDNGAAPHTSDSLSRRDGKALADTLRHEPVLFIWDQAQNLLTTSLTEHGSDQPEFADNAVLFFLRRLRSATQAKLLLVSTEDPSQLLTQELGFEVDRQQLGGLSIEDTRNILDQLDRGDDWEKVRPIWSHVAGHALTVVQAVERIATQQTPFADLGEGDLRQIRNRTLESTLAGLPPNYAAYLQALAAYGPAPVPITIADDLARAVALSQEEQANAVDRFERLGLLSPRHPDILLHAVARGVAYKQMSGDARIHIHARLASHLRKRCRDRGISIRTEASFPVVLDPFRVLIQQTHLPRIDRKDLEARIDYCIHCIRSGATRPAFHMVANVVAAAIYFGEGDYQRLITLLEEFRNRNQFVDFVHENRQRRAWMLMALGNCNARVGKTTLALELLNDAIEDYEALRAAGDDSGRLHAIARGNRAFDLALMGRLSESYRDQEERIRSLEQLEADKRSIGFDCGTAELGKAYVDLIRGRFTEVSEQIKRAERWLDESPGVQGTLYLEMMKVLNALAQGRAAKDHIQRASEVLNLAEQLGVNSDIARGHWLLVQVYMALAVSETAKKEEHLKRADGCLQSARERCNRINLIHLEVELDLLAGSLELLKEAPNRSNVEKHAERAVARAEMCGAQPSLAEAFLLWAFIAHRWMSPGDVQGYLGKAYELSNCNDADNRIHKVCFRIEQMQDTSIR